MNKALKGFTLIELLVTISIMVTLISLFLANIAGTSDQRNLALAKSNFLSDVHKMQSFSLSSLNYNPSTPASAWAVSINLNSSQQYQLQNFDNNLTPNLQIISTIKLPSNVYIKSISVRPNGVPTGICADSDLIKFKVPYARIVQTYKGGSDCATQQTTEEPNDVTDITLSTKDNAFTTIFRINGISGNITVPSN